MLAEYLILASAAIAFSMGSGHLWLTLSSNAFRPRDAALYEQIKSAPLNFSRRLLLGPSLTGFNASHSLGPMLFGAIYFYLALEHGEFLFQSPFLLALGAVFLLAYILLAWRYWFYAPLTGLSVAFAFYLGGLLAAYSG